MAGRAAAYVFAAGYGAVLIGRTAGRRISVRRGSGGGNLRRIFGYGSALLVIDGAITLFYRLDAILIGAIISVPAVGRFEAAGQLAGFLGYGGQSIGAAVAPRMARTEDEPPDVPLFERGLRLVMLVQGLFIAPLVVWAGPITSLILGPGYGESADVLRVMAPFAFLVGISPMVSLSVNYLGEARRRIGCGLRPGDQRHHRPPPAQQDRHRRGGDRDRRRLHLLRGHAPPDPAPHGPDPTAPGGERLPPRPGRGRRRRRGAVRPRHRRRAAGDPAGRRGRGPAAYVAALLALRAVDVAELRWGWRQLRAALPGSPSR